MWAVKNLVPSLKGISNIVLGYVVSLYRSVSHPATVPIQAVFANRQILLCIVLYFSNFSYRFPTGIF